MNELEKYVCALREYGKKRKTVLISEVLQVVEKFTSTNSAMDAICPACNNTGVVNHGVDGLSYCGCSAGERAKQHQ